MCMMMRFRGSFWRPIHRLVLATGNPGKVREMRSLLAELPIRVIPATEIEDAPSVDETQVGSGLRGRKVRDGSDVCILAVGKMLGAAEDAAARLEAEGISATVWDVRSVTPLDEHMLDDAGGHPLVVTIEDGIRDGGCGSAIRDRLAGTDASVEVLGVPTDYVAHGNVDQLLAQLGLDAEGIVETVLAARRQA